ncbi:MAG: alpha/beta fold hydrolase [Cyclobacteriaceae bacterium]|nr:alpha/beta fold hydrolase [Cyclobacteriaceae bacterium]MCH8517735.1 alpha/beta fold hydrolase [Cyclobacteriaceae bacterium]
MNIHQHSSTLSRGDKQKANKAMILVHGRGATAASILELANEIDPRNELYCLAPQAEGNTWYPYGFMEEKDKNQPGLDSGLSKIGELVDQLRSEGFSDDQIYILGFSQGACLSLEYAARYSEGLGGVFALSGGLIGPMIQPEIYHGKLAETSVFLGCSDVDFHIPEARVRESASLFENRGAQVDMRIYKGMGHTVNIDEINAIKETLYS